MRGSIDILAKAHWCREGDKGTEYADEKFFYSLLMESQMGEKKRNAGLKTRRRVGKNDWGG